VLNLRRSDTRKLIITFILKNRDTGKLITKFNYH
jgi:hypothetical protein